MLEEELDHIKQRLPNNVYPEFSFLRIYEKHQNIFDSDNKKELHRYLSFKWDSKSELLIWRLKNATTGTFSAATLQ